MFTSDYHKASTAKGNNGTFMVVTTITMAAGDGSGSAPAIYGPAYAGVLATSASAKRPGYRLAIYKITGVDSVAASGTRTAVLFTFKTTGTGTGIIARFPTAIDITLGTTNGWVVEDALRDTPLVVGDAGGPGLPPEGVQIFVAAAGDDSTIPIEVLCKMVPILTPKPTVR